MFFRFLGLSLIASALLYWFCIRLTPSDPILYDKLVQESIQLRTRKALEEEPAHQKRSGVLKDIWTQNEASHFQIQSEDSDLTISQKRGKFEAIERLKTMSAQTENEFTLEADEGIYTYPSHQLIAKDNCHLRQNESVIDGSLIHLDMVKEVVAYENPKGYLKKGPYFFTAKKLLWDKKNNKLHLIDQVEISQPNSFNLLANLGTVDLNNLEPTLITLEGNVRLISSKIQGKESYAVADRLTYCPIEKTLTFSADRRVLFWQDGLSLSASEILILEDQAVEGRGDVHFTFNLEEQNYIDELFRQYL